VATEHISIVILAAGGSERFGRPKQLEPLRGRPLVQHAINAAAASGAGEVVVVLGASADDVEAAITLPAGARVVVNLLHAQGQSTSLQAGLRALDDPVGAAVILLGDQPGIAPETIRRVVDAWRDRKPAIVQARYHGLPGHPVLFAREVWPQLLAVTGDRGARDVLAADARRIAWVDVESDPPPDIDTPRDLMRLDG
jgi:molybdenum cofactor cytidylyltransferase